MDDLEKERLRYEEIAKVREWETMHPVKNLLLTISATLFAGLLCITPFVVFGVPIVLGLIDLLQMLM